MAALALSLWKVWMGFKVFFHPPFLDFKVCGAALPPGSAGARPSPAARCPDGNHGQGGDESFLGEEHQVQPAPVPPCHHLQVVPAHGHVHHPPWHRRRTQPRRVPVWPGRPPAPRAVPALPGAGEGPEPGPCPPLLRQVPPGLSLVLPHLERHPAPGLGPGQGAAAAAGDPVGGLGAGPDPALLRRPRRAVTALPAVREFREFRSVPAAPPPTQSRFGEGGASSPLKSLDAQSCFSCPTPVRRARGCAVSPRWGQCRLCVPTATSGTGVGGGVEGPCVEAGQGAPLRRAGRGWGTGDTTPLLQSPQSPLSLIIPQFQPLLEPLWVKTSRFFLVEKGFSQPCPLWNKAALVLHPVCPVCAPHLWDRRVLLWDLGNCCFPEGPGMGKHGKTSLHLWEEPKPVWGANLCDFEPLGKGRSPTEAPSHFPAPAPCWEGLPLPIQGAKYWLFGENLLCGGGFRWEVLTGTW